MWPVLAILHLIQVSTMLVDGSLLDNTGRRLVRVVTSELEPYVNFKWEPWLRGNERFDGFLIDILQEISLRANFSFQLQLAAGGQVGSPGEDGSWNGLIGHLTAEGSEQAEIALIPMAVTDERRAAVDFSAPIAEETRLAALLPTNSSSGLLLNASSHVQFGVVRGSDVDLLLQQSTDPALKSLWMSISANGYAGYVYNVHEGLQRVRSHGRSQGKFALLVGEQEAEFTAASEPCDIAKRAISSSIALPRAFAFRKESSLLSLFNVHLKEMMSSGRWEAMRRRWWPSSCGAIQTSMVAPYNHTTTQSASLIAPTTMDRRRLTITTMESAPFFMRSEQPGRHFEGYLVDLIRHLAQTVPFEYDWRLQRGFGKRSTPSGPTGMIGDLNADLAAAAFVVEEKQDRFLSFSKPFLHSTLSILMSASDDMPIIFMEDLFNHTDLSLGVIKNSRAEKLLRRSRMPLYKQVWRKIKGPGKRRSSTNIVRTIDQGLTRVRRGSFALILESTDAAYLSAHPPCDLVALDQFMSITNYALALRKDSPLVQDIDRALLRLQEDGVLQRLFHSWWNRGECLRLIDAQLGPSSNSSANSAGLSDRDRERIVLPDILVPSMRRNNNASPKEARTTRPHADGTATTAPMSEVHHSAQTNPTRVSENHLSSSPSAAHSSHSSTHSTASIPPPEISQNSDTSVVSQPYFSHTTSPNPVPFTSASPSFNHKHSNDSHRSLTLNSTNHTSDTFTVSHKESPHYSKPTKIDVPSSTSAPMSQTLPSPLFPDNLDLEPPYEAVDSEDSLEEGKAKSAAEDRILLFVSKKPESSFMTPAYHDDTGPLLDFMNLNLTSKEVELGNNEKEEFEHSEEEILDIEPESSTVFSESGCCRRTDGGLYLLLSCLILYTFAYTYR